MRVFAVVLFALWTIARPAVADDPIFTRFEVYGPAGIRVLTMSGRTEESGDHYRVSIDYQTRGLASIFLDLATHIRVRGRLVGNQAQPELFRDDTRRNGVDRHSQVDYTADGSIDGATTPLPAPLTPATVRGTIDNLTAYFRLERQLARTGSCALTARIFDGRHGYDLVFSNSAEQARAPASGPDLTKNAIACRMERRNWPNFTNPEKDEGARQGTIWYARLLPGDLLVPVRTQMDTQIGVVDGFLTQLHGRGVNLVAME